MRNRNQMMMEFQQRSDSAIHDPFERHPIRRSFLMVVGCALVLLLPWIISDEAGESVMISIGWLALTGIVIGIPVLIISLIELAATVDSLPYLPPDRPSRSFAAGYSRAAASWGRNNC